jgi:SAM-dependent methyltransferase
MEPAAYIQLAEIEDSHWWFVHRRKLMAHLLSKAGFLYGKSGLDVGCGTGGNLPFLKGYCDTVKGIDLSPDAIALASRKYSSEHFIHGDINELPSLFSAESFDLITDFSVLCHRWIQSDLESMRDIHDALKPGGVFALTEPSFPILRRAHDRIADVMRRYTLPQITSLLQTAGFERVFGTYFNLPSFPFAFGLAMLDRLGLFATSEKGRIKEIELPSRWTNNGLSTLMKVELSWIKAVGSVPFGVSVACIALKA